MTEFHIGDEVILNIPGGALHKQHGVLVRRPFRWDGSVIEDSWLVATPGQSHQTYTKETEGWVISEDKLIKTEARHTGNKTVDDAIEKWEKVLEDENEPQNTVASLISHTSKLASFWRLPSPLQRLFR